MAGRILFALMAAQWLLAPSLAFTARSVSRHVKTELHSSLSTMSEQEAAYLMAKARECAFSDSCSIEESRSHLHDVLNIQVACASGAVNGQDVCDDQQETAEIVAHLRQNTETHLHGSTPRQQAVAAGSVLPIVFLALTCFSMMMVNADPAVTPFTFQEVVWATRDGYLDDLVLHFFKNGGLVVADAAVPFNFQEVVWAAKGGYLDDMMSHFIRNGGL
jgi:hypothetical protein